VKLSLNWLSDFVELPGDVEELCSRLTLLGLEVEAVDPIRIAYPGVVVGRVVEVAAHPDADRLRVCRVNVGADELEIVCGAPNVRADQFVPVATIGAVLPGDFRIKRTKIRGVSSQGMICSERELGLGDAHEGIMVLNGQLRAGQLFDELYAYADTCVEIEVTPNRPDWLSHIGVAREIAAYYGVELRLPPVDDPVEIVEVDHDWRVVVEDRVGCPRFTARLVDGARVGASPLWMRQRLTAIGQRPINSIVDASNYVLHECGHPTHCFDRRRLKGKTIHLRKPRAGEILRTLDGIERKLEPHHLLVADEESAIALAGIMGGAESEVGEQTTDLLLEVAVFDPRTIRKGRRAVGLNTDASYRFERGVDFEAVPWVGRRLVHLITEVAGGRAHSVVVEGRGEAPAAAARFFVRSRQVQRVLGVEIEPARMAELLGCLQIPARPTERRRREGVEVTQPSFRHDLLE
jgi:phenylalanyl-tRNA synthetase beta chain